MVTIGNEVGMTRSELAFEAGLNYADAMTLIRKHDIKPAGKVGRAWLYNAAALARLKEVAAARTEAAAAV